MKIKILVTGGTLDKEYDEINAKLIFNETNLPEMLKQGRSKVDVDITTLVLLDSLDLTDNDRQLILEKCKNSSEERIIITHGTDTMIDTARVLANEINNKTVVLTGAMIPYSIKGSDSLFNLGSAIAFTQTLPHGIYIAMNGKYFEWDKTRKNKTIGEFESID